jgi:predicted nucleic acid-binding protein
MSQRVVFDCMVFLQGAMRASGPAAACFGVVDDGTVDLCVSTEFLAEVKDVFARPSLQRRYKTLAPEKTQRFMADVERKVTRVADVPAVFSLDRDPKLIFDSGATLQA